MKRSFASYRYSTELIMVLNSAICMVSAYVVIKSIIAFSRYLLMRHFEAHIVNVNFDIISDTRPFSVIWTQLSVVSIYGIGVVISALLIILGIYGFNRFKYMRGMTKLWFLWFYVWSVSLTLGTIVKDVVFKIDFYWALNWLFIPDNIMIFIATLALSGLFVISYFYVRKFLRLSISLDLVKSRRMRTEVYTVVAVIPAIVGAYFLLFLHFFEINRYDKVEQSFISIVFEQSMLIISIFVPYINVYRDNRPVNLLKNERTNIFNNKMLTFAIIIFATVYMIKFFIIPWKY